MKLQGLLILLIASALAPIAAAKCRTKHFNATFDNLPDGHDIPDGYAGLRYSNWYRTKATDLIPNTKPNYLQAEDSNLGYLTLDFPPGYDATIQFHLHSFYMGCAANFGSGPLPVGCTVTVTTKTFTNLIGIEQHNFTFALKGQGKKLFKMQKMETGDIAASAMYFSVADGVGGTQLYIDSLELSQDQCK